MSTAHPAVPCSNTRIGGSRSEVSVERSISSWLEAVAAREQDVRAWAYIDLDQVVEQARALDRLIASGRRPGPLHGFPVGLKDIIDTRDMPTEDGTILDSG